MSPKSKFKTARFETETHHHYQLLLKLPMITQMREQGLVLPRKSAFKRMRIIGGEDEVFEDFTHSG